MTIARDSMTDLLALAAMPGLELIGEALASEVGCSADDALMCVWFIGAQWVTGSRNELTALLSHRCIWDEIRASAARVGRVFPLCAPTHNMLRHRLSGHNRVGAIVAAAFPMAMRELIRSAGLLADGPNRCHRPERVNTVFGDGTVFKPASDVEIDPDTRLAVGSRSKTGNPRLVDRFHGKSGQDSVGRSGFPVCVLGVRGDSRHQRGILAVDTYFDRDEVGAALRLLGPVKKVFGGGVHALAYDKLMSGIHLQQVMQMGIVPIVDMPNASNNGLAVPDYLQDALGSRSQPKRLAVCEYLTTVEAPTGATSCRHHLWALDGTIVCCADDELAPSWSSPPCTQVSLEFVQGPGGTQRLIGRYQIPCRRAHPLFEFDHSGDRPGARGSTKAVADWVRPLDLLTRHELRGFRQDIESTFSTSKRLAALDGRAFSYTTDPFLFDMVGFALLTNSTLWDVHVAQHTDNGRRLAQAAANKKLRRTSRRS